MISVGNYVLDASDCFRPSGCTTVFLGYDVGSKVEVCVKRIEKSKVAESQWALVKNEPEMLRCAQGHANVVNLKSSFVHDGFLYIVCEAWQLDLLEFVEERPLDECLIKHLFRQLVSAVRYLHHKCIVHGDLKLDNVLFDPASSRIALTDFGSSKLLPPGKELTSGLFASPCYTPPEVFLEEQYNAFKAEIYCLGIFLFCLSYGETPFEDELGAIYYPRLKKQYQLKRPRQDLVFSTRDKSRSTSLQDTITQLLRLHPESRPTIAQLLQQRWLRTK